MSAEAIVSAPLDTRAIYAERARRAAEAMAETGVTQALFVSSGRHLFTDMDPVVWLTGFKPMRTAAAVIDSSGSVLLYTDGDWEAKRAERVGPSAQIVAAANPFAEAAAELASRASGERVGSAGVRKLNTLEYRTIVDGGSYQLVSIDTELDARARLKDRARAGRLPPGGGDLRAGVQLTARAAAHRHDRRRGRGDHRAQAARARGRRRVRLLVRLDSQPGRAAPVGPDPDARRHPADRAFPCVGSVFAQICRTVAFGAPSKELVHDHQLLMGAMEQGVAACKAGNTVSEVVQAMDAPLIAQGLGEYTKPPFMRVRGHGMGFGSVAPGDFLTKNQLVLQAGDTFVLHPNQALPGAGYLMCGEPVIVGEQAGEIVTGRIAPLDIVEA